MGFWDYLKDLDPRKGLDPESYKFNPGESDRAKGFKKDLFEQGKRPNDDALNQVAGDAGGLAGTAQNSYYSLTGRLNGSLNDLQQRANGQNSVSAMQLHQALQQNLASQRSLAQSGSPGNAGMSARTAAIQMGRLGTGLAGQQALAGQQERNAAQDAYAAMLGQARGLDAQTALGAYNTQISGLGGNQQQQPEKTKLEKIAPAALGIITAMSDRRAKTDIGPGSDKANQALGRLSAYSYRYKDEAHGRGSQLGVMAQDLEDAGLRSVVIDTPRGKMVDGAKLSTANTAMLSTLADRVDELEKRKPYRGGISSALSALK